MVESFQWLPLFSACVSITTALPHLFSDADIKSYTTQLYLIGLHILGKK